MVNHKKLPGSTILRIFILLLLGVLGGIVVPASPVIGTILIILGLGGTLWSLLSFEARCRLIESQIETQSFLLWRSGAGNQHFEAFIADVGKYRTIRPAIERLQKAIELDPSDGIAMAFLAAVLAMEFSTRQGITQDHSSVKPQEVSFVKELAQKAMKFAPKNSLAHDAMGIIFDVEGKHEQARQEFRKAGKLGSPVWRLEMSTSWGLEGKSENALEEVLAVLKEKPEHHFMLDFYHGRALVSCGRYAEAIPVLRKAFAVRSMQPELLSFISEAYYMMARFYTSALFELRLSLTILPVFPLRGSRFLIESLHHFVLGISCYLSKALWRFSRRIPVLAFIHKKTIAPFEPEATLANMLWDQGHYDWGLVLIQRAVDTCPEEARLWADLARFRMAVGQYEDVIPAIDRALHAEPNNKAWKYNRELFVAVLQGKQPDLNPLSELLSHKKYRHYAVRIITPKKRKDAKHQL